MHHLVPVIGQQRSCAKWLQQTAPGKKLAPGGKAKAILLRRAVELWLWSQLVTLMIPRTIRREGLECEWGAIQLLQYPGADCCLGQKDPAVLFLFKLEDW